FEGRKFGFVGSGSVGNECVEGLFQDGPSKNPLGAVIYPVRRQPSQIGQIGFFKQPLAEQGLQVNEVRVAGKGGKALIGRVSKTCWTKGTNLPTFHPGFVEEINEAPRFSPKRSYAR